MSRRPARFTQADVAWALRAAQQMDPPWIVEITPDGTIRLVPAPTAPAIAMQDIDPATAALNKWRAGRPGVSGLRASKPSRKQAARAHFIRNEGAELSTSPLPRVLYGPESARGIWWDRAPAIVVSYIIPYKQSKVSLSTLVDTNRLIFSQPKLTATKR